MAHITMRKVLQAPVDAVLTRVSDALKTEGFGVLTQIDRAPRFLGALGAHETRSRSAESLSTALGPRQECELKTDHRSL